MKLDIKERLQLSYTLKILEKLYPEDSDYYARHRKAIEDGYELHYEWITEHLSEGLSSEECSFVLDILDLYSTMHHSFKQFKDTENISETDVIFKGFDGNKETMYMAYTKYFIEDLDRFSDIKDATKGYYNSHSRKVPKYKAMVEKWMNLETDNKFILTKDQILEIINVPVY